MSMNPKDDFVEDDLFAEEEEDLFAAEEEEVPEKSADRVWKLLIVDDEVDVHQMTSVVLENYTYEDKPLEIISAYSAEQAKQILVQHANIALILLDVVMETHDAGLKLAQYIRETLKNEFVRIVLRTGQPGYAPEKEVISKYDINDYTNKAELTAQKIFTLVTANIRAYSDLIIIESYRQHLEDKVAERTHELSERNAELVALNHRLKTLNEQLLELNREKNEFLGIAAHDLRNPLSAIKGYAEEIQEYLADMPEEEVIELASLISISSQQMSELLKNLLDVNAIESGNKNLSLGIIDILPTLQSLVNSYTERSKEKNITLQFQCLEKQYTAFVDENTVRQVLDNLLSNAVKYSPHGKNISIQLSKNDTHLRCEIQDEGPGLTDSDKQKLFGKFNRLTAKPTGGEQSTGLGLFIVKKLVEAMNGSVWCESELGHGATFIVELALHPQ
jgi:two-component system, sensor histidine kinase and response regulator